MSNHRVIHEGEPDGSRRLPLHFTSTTPPLTPSSSPFPCSASTTTSNSSAYSSTGPLPSVTAAPSAPHTNAFSQSSSMVSPSSPSTNNKPAFVHKWSHSHAILSVVSSAERGLLFCGTQNAKILVFDLTTYQKVHTLIGHTGSILAMDISNDYLFTAGSDSLIKVWDLSSGKFNEIITGYSLLDIGDIFSLTWCDILQGVFIGCQNASILFAKLPLRNELDDEKPLKRKVQKKPNYESLPAVRYDKFFDSKGPGGSMNKIQMQKCQTTDCHKFNSSNLIEISNDDVVRFAHNGYVYAMQIVDLSLDFTKQFNDNNNDNFVVMLLSAGGDGKVNIWGCTLQGKLKLVNSLDNGLSVLCISLQNSYLYCGLSNGYVKLWDLNTLQQIKTFSNADEGDIMSIANKSDCIFKATRQGVTKCKMMGDKLEDWVTADGVALTVSIMKRNNHFYLITGGDKLVTLYDITQVGDELTQENSPIPTPSAFDSLELSSSSQLLTQNSLSNEDLLSHLSQFISFKTVSKKPELYLDDSRKCATFLRSLFIKMGAVSKLLPVPNGNPIVYACFKQNCKAVNTKTTEKPIRILWYGHYDVVDAEYTNSWATPPFELTAANGNIYARGVSDNKGPILASMYSVADLYQRKKLTADITFLIEGEEESGSIGFQDVISDHKHLVGEIDWILLSNSYWLDDVTPCLNYGLRGVINATVKISSDKPDRHSGVDGGVSKEAAIDLMQLLGQLVDKNNKILIPGFYEPVNPLTENEKKLYEKITQKVSNGVSVDTLLAKWRNPSLTIHKFIVSGPNNHTVIPQTAEASISMRIVPHQNLSEIKRSLIEYVTHVFENELNSDNHLEINIFHEAEPWLGDPTNDAFQILARAVEAEWGVEPVFIREGGSIPSIRFLEKCFDAPAAQIPCGQSSDNAHLNNEKLRIINLYKLRKILSRTFMELPCASK